MILTFFIYNIILVFSCSFAFLAENQRNRRKELFCRFVVFLVLWLPASIRYNIGTDYSPNVEVYENISFFQENIEPAYFYIIQALRYIEADVQWLFVVSGFLIYFPICFRLPQKGYFMMITMYALTLYLASYSLVRQSIAISFIVCATISLLEKKNLFYFFYILLASSFHYSALLMFLFYFVRYLKYNRCIFLCIVTVGIIGIVLMDFSSIIMNSDLFLNSSYGHYTNSSFNRDTEIEGTGLAFLCRCMIPCLAFGYIQEINKLGKEYNFIIGMSIILLFSLCLGFQIHIFNRLVNLVNYILFIDLGIYYLCSVGLRKKSLLFILFCFFFIFQREIVSQQSGKNMGLGISPYKSVLFK